MFRLLENIRSKCTYFFQKWQAVLVTASTITGVVIAANHLGILQVLEWACYDQFFRVRPPEALDNRIVIVTIDEQDITYLNHWPLSDQVIAQIIKIINEQQPRVIALDIYRDLKVEPGHQQLVEVFENTPILIGVEKVSGRPVAPSPILAQKGQVALADLVIDSDSKVRRSLLSARREDGEIQLSLGTRAALQYLEAEGIFLEPIEENTLDLRLGKARFSPLKPNEGAYINADNGGYQILLNYRGLQDKFLTLSLQDLLNKNFSPNLMQDKIVFIGSIAESLKDQFSTPYGLRTGGVVIHANIASQIMSSAIQGRSLIRGIPDTIEWLWIFLWSLIGAVVSWKLVINNNRQQNIYAFFSLLIISMIVPGAVLIVSSYSLFLQGIWIPLFSPFAALSLAALLIPSYQNFEWQKIASIDGLTKVPNRRYFDSYLVQTWEQHKEKKNPLSVILCDVDHFKLYNDHYGHLEGDQCLKQVSKALVNSVRKTDLVARYGGEEFVIILPNANASTAAQIAERVCLQVQALQIEHKTSKINQWVTLSCGVSSIVPDAKFSPAMLVERADQALYQAKEQGRNGYCSIN